MSLGNVITIAVTLVGVVASWANLQATQAEQKRNHDKLEARVERLEGADAAQNRMISDLQREIITRLVRLETLLDTRPPPVRQP
jgi:hypothetical protein